MRDFTLADFDTHFGADMDALGTVSFDDPYIAGEDAAFPMQTAESEKLVRARRYQPAGAAQTDGSLFTRRGWVPGDGVTPCAVLSGGSLTYRRGAVYTASALVQTGESFDYVRKRFFFCPDSWGTGQVLRFSFRGWAWSPDNRASGVWTEYTQPDGVWTRTGTFSQQTGGGIE